MSRPAPMQILFDAIRAAVDGSAQGSAAAKAAAGRVFDRLAAGPGVRGTASGQRLPVCDHLEAALAQAHPSRTAVALAVRDVLPRLVWGRKSTSGPDGTGFQDGHANAMLAGPGGLEARDDLWVGLTVMAPGTLYPDHSHPPEETYLALTPGQWWNSAMDWTDPGEAGLIHNPPGITHAMRAAPDRPFLALWLLPV